LTLNFRAPNPEGLARSEREIDAAAGRCEAAPMPFNPLGLQPSIRDGLRGEALVARSAAGPDSSGVGENKGYMGGFRLFTATTSLIVRVPGAAPFHVMPQRLATREKYAVVGMRLPLTVSRDLRRLKIEWDEVPTVDELIERGERMFTDPDSVAAELEAAWLEVAAHAGGYPPQRMPRAPIDGPNARVLAVGHGANDHETVIVGKWELLLSVSVPGRPRYGHRWKHRVPRGTIVLPGADIPLVLNGDEIEIPWDRIGAAWRIAAPAAAAPAGGPPPPAAAALDPLDQLTRLVALRDAGALTDAEFAAEKARVLGGP
jgi:hypothetical protein